MNKTERIGIFLLIFIAAAATSPLTVSAHAPYFEDDDFTAESPFFIADPAVSLALFSTLESASDRDYFVFDVQAGQTVWLAMTIPQIEGLEGFDPVFTIYGTGLPGSGETIPSVPATEFYEPYGGRTYWRRQRVNYTFPEAGRVTVMVHHPAGKVGQYVFAPGTAERGGGDPAYQPKINQYWRPLAQPTAWPTNTPLPRPTATPRPLPTNTPIPQPTAIPTVWPTRTPIPQPTAIPTVWPTHTPRPQPTRTPLPQPTNTVVSISTPRPTATPIPPTITPSRQPTLQPTATPSPQSDYYCSPSASHCLTHEINQKPFRL